VLKTAPGEHSVTYKNLFFNSGRQHSSLLAAFFITTTAKNKKEAESYLRHLGSPPHGVADLGHPAES
jgi:hypothetical protein